MNLEPVSLIIGIVFGVLGSFLARLILHLTGADRDVGGGEGYDSEDPKR